jgi:hypothetical protein
MAKTITIYVQLNDATLQGRRSLKLSGSTCRLGIVPKDLMRNTLSNPKLNEQLLNKYSFYMLLSDSSVGAYSVYIGKARSFSERVLSHLREKPNWHTALVFNSSDPGFLTDTEINYLEHLAVKLAKELHPELTENAVVPAKPAISPEREDEMDDFFEDIKLLTGFYGCTVFEEPVSIETISSSEKPFTLSIPLEPERVPSVRIAPLENENMKQFYVFHIDKPKGVNANLYYNYEENRYIIAKGSVIKATDGEIRPNQLRMRQEVISNPDMSEQEGDYYKLKGDIELLKSSRSDSASFCTGVSTNGNKGWVDSRGRTFKEVFPK